MRIQRRCADLIVRLKASRLGTPIPNRRCGSSIAPVGRMAKNADFPRASKVTGRIHTPDSEIVLGIEDARPRLREGQNQKRSYEPRATQRNDVPPSLVIDIVRLPQRVSITPLFTLSTK